MPHSEERRAKISAALKGRPRSDEHNAAIGRGRNMSVRGLALCRDFDIVVCYGNDSRVTLHPDGDITLEGRRITPNGLSHDPYRAFARLLAGVMTQAEESVYLEEGAGG